MDKYCLPDLYNLTDRELDMLWHEFGEGVGSHLHDKYLAVKAIDENDDIGVPYYHKEEGSLNEILNKLRLELVTGPHWRNPDKTDYLVRHLGYVPGNKESEWAAQLASSVHKNRAILIAAVYWVLQSSGRTYSVNIPVMSSGTWAWGWYDYGFEEEKFGTTSREEYPASIETYYEYRTFPEVE